jgi:hypothetical protein
MFRSISRTLLLAVLIVASAACGDALNSSDDVESNGSVEFTIENDTSSAISIQEWIGPPPSWYEVKVDKPTHGACGVARCPEVSKAACGAPGPDAKKLEPGEKATDNWDGIFWPQRDKGDNICEYQQAAPAKEYTVEFCWGTEVENATDDYNGYVKESTVECKEATFELGTDKTLTVTPD